MCSVTRAVFGELPSGGGTVEKFRLQSDLLRVDIISWGCTITAIEVKDRPGRASDVVLGFADLEGGLNSAPGSEPAPGCKPPGSIGLLAMRGAEGKVAVYLGSACIMLTEGWVAIRCLGKTVMNGKSYGSWPLVIRSGFAPINVKSQLMVRYTSAILEQSLNCLIFELPDPLRRLERKKQARGGVASSSSLVPWSQIICRRICRNMKNADS